MSESSGPFDSGAGQAINNSQWRDLLNWLNGTLDGGLAVTAGTGMAVNVASGKAAVSGLWYSNTASKAVTIATADPTNPRIDLICVQADLSGQTVLTVVRAGTPGVSPVAPTVQRTSSFWEIALAQVRVPAGATTSASFTITDERLAAQPWTPTNGGSGSGLDADKLDSHDSSYFLAASSYTAADVLSKIETVDGTGSGLDADKLDGHDSTYFLQTLQSAGGGSAGTKIWVGTTDPAGAAGEGDVWISG